MNVTSKITLLLHFLNSFFPVSALSPSSRQAWLCVHGLSRAQTLCSSADLCRVLTQPQLCHSFRGARMTLYFCLASLQRGAVIFLWGWRGARKRPPRSGSSHKGQKDRTPPWLRAQKGTRETCGKDLNKCWKRCFWITGIDSVNRVL